MGICQSKDSASVDRIEGFHGDLNSKKDSDTETDTDTDSVSSLDSTLVISDLYSDSRNENNEFPSNIDPVEEQQNSKNSKTRKKRQFKREQVERILEKKDYESKIDFERRAWSELELEREKWNKLELERRTRSKLELQSRVGSKTSNINESKTGLRSKPMSRQGRQEQDVPSAPVQRKSVHEKLVGTENVILQFFHGRKRKKKKRNLNLNSEFHAKQQLTLFIPLKDRIESVTCNPNQIFKLRDNSDEVWWEVSTVDPETHQPVSGYTSKYNFYPKDSERREDQYPWFLGNLSREESEELLHNSANPQGAFLLRFSNNKNQFVLSVKKFNEENSKWEMSHLNIHEAVNKETGKVKLYLKRNEKFSSLEKLLNHYLTEAVDLSPFNLTTICILSNPISDPAFLRRWELESETDAWQVPREEIELLEELGHGFFGTVNRGIWRNQIPVAVKTLRVDKGSRNNHEKEKETFLKETEIMKRLNHPHVVKMFGVCIEKSPFYLIQELCVNGDLLHHLRKFLFLKFPHDKRKDKDENIPRFHTTLVWSLQILKGMEYLESRSLVHRDLAARNVLLDRGFQAKVADFGLTFDRLDEKEEEGKPIIAVYWSAPEAIDKREFSHKSDVWSFGVTMWELVSLADRPYNGLPKEKLKEKLKEGPFLMDPPKNYFRTPQYLMDSVYNLLKDCWERNPRSRPSFKVLQGRVESIMKENIKFKNRTKRNAWNEKSAKMKSRISIADRLPEPSFNYTGSTATAYDYDINKYERHK